MTLIKLGNLCKILHLLLDRSEISFVKKFKFKLQTYLNLKELEEKKQFMLLSRIVQNINRADETSRFFQKEHSRFIDRAVKEFKQQKLNVSHYKIVNQYFRDLKKKEKLVQEQADALQNELLQKQQDVLEASKNKKLITILKNKEYEKYRKRILKLEQEVIDECNRRKQ